MHRKHDSQRQIISRYGAHKSWANTADRAARTRRARGNSPSSIAWHLKHLPAHLDCASDAQRLAAAESARKAYFAELAMKSAAARRRGGSDAA